MRTLSESLQAAVVAPVVRFIWLVRIEFDEGVVAWNTGYRPISFDGHTYIGAGPLGNISSIKESSGVKASGVSITLSGIKPEIVSLALSVKYLGRKAYIHCAASDEAWNFDSDKVKLMFYGTVDNIEGVQGNSASFTVSLKSRLSDWERRRSLKYTDADQQKLYPGDKGMEFIPQISQKKIVWPRAAFLPDPRD